MVLTNFELWAADGSSATHHSAMPLEFETTAHHNRHHLNPFDPRAILPAQLNTNLTHLSSNGYYGFSYINAAHDMEELNNNNNNTVNNNNNSSTSYNFMANDVNGMNNATMSATTTPTTIPPQTHAASAINFGSAVNVAGDAAANVTRCKKRFFVMNDGDAAAATNKNPNGFAKRCRFDDDFAAQYCNDFFSLPATQIATQSCLMDTEMEVQHQNTTSPLHQQNHQIQQQQQVVEGTMFENNNNNIEKFEQNLHLQLQYQQEQSQNITQSSTPSSQQQNSTQEQSSQPQQQQQQHLFHQQQHYQDDTLKRHNFNNSCVTLSLKNNNNHIKCTKIDSQKTENLLKSHKSDFKVDDATLYSQIHGGCLHHFVARNSNGATATNNTTSITSTNYKHFLQDDNYYEEF